MVLWISVCGGGGSLLLAEGRRRSLWLWRGGGCVVGVLVMVGGF